MDKLNEEWLKGKPNFYFLYKRKLIESLIEGSCLNVGCGSHIIEGATNIDEGLPNLPYGDNSFDTVICSDVLEHIGPHKQSVAELLRVSKKKVIITAPAYRWLYSKYDALLGHKRRYHAEDFSGFEVEHLFWFLLPVIFLRKLLGLRHRPLPEFVEKIFFVLSKIHLSFGTTILAIKYKVPYEARKKYKISLFVPVFNEEKIIDRDIKAIDYIIKSLPVEYEIFIVNDASKDKTEIIAKKIEHANRKVTLLNYDIGPTRRENLAQSFRNATGDIITFVDIDLLASMRFFSDLIDQVRLGFDIVTGSRYVRGSRIKRKPFRLFYSVLYNAFIRFIFKTKIRDHMCGFKAFKREAILRLIEEMGYDRTLKRGIFWDTELLVRANCLGYKIKEIPIWWKERNKSALYFRREVKSLLYALSFAFKLKTKIKFSAAQKNISKKNKTGVLYISYDGLCDPLGQSQILPYINGLSGEDFNIFVLSFEKELSLRKRDFIEKQKLELSSRGIGWKYLGYHNKPRILGTVYDITCGLFFGLILIRKFRLSILHARGYISSFIAFCLKRLVKIKFIFDMRGFWIEEKVDANFIRKGSISYRIAKHMEKGLLKSADQVIVLTEKAKSLLINSGAKPERGIEVIPTCVNLERFDSLKTGKRDFLQNKVVVLYSGSIGSFYAFGEMVRFFKEFQAREPNSFFLALINNGREAAEDTFRENGIKEESYKVLSLYHLEVSDWLKEADISLIFYRRHNSYAGCCPTKFAESLACGVPVIINKNIGDCEEMVRKEGVGLVVADFAESTFRKASDDFLSILKARPDLHIRCREVAQNSFSLEMGIKKYLKVYHRIV